MRKSQINIFLILGAFIVVVFGVATYTTTKITEKRADNELSNIALSPGQIAPVTTYTENLLYTLSEEALFNEVGAVEHAHLLSLDEMKNILIDYIKNNFNSELDLSEFESSGMEISKQDIGNVDVNINPNDVTVTLEYPWAIKLNNIKNTIYDFKTILFVRLGLVYNISAYLADKINNEGAPLNPYVLKPEDCAYISNIGGQDSSGLDYVEATINSGVITITDRYTEKFYFQKPFTFKFGIANVNDGSC